MAELELELAQELELVSSSITVKTAAAFSINPLAIELITKAWPVEDIPSDLSVKGNYDKVKDGISAHKTARLALTSEHKDFKSPILAAGKELDGAKKDGLALLAPGEEAWKKAKKDYDTAVEIAKREAIRIEDERVTGINARIAEIKALPLAHISSNADILGLAMAELAVTGTGFADEFAEPAQAAIDETLGQLDSLLVNALRVEAAEEVAAKAAAEREAAEAKLKADAEAAQAKLAEDNRIAAAKLKQQQEEMAEAQAKLKADTAKLEADKRAVKDAADKAENDKIAATAKAKAEQEAADKAALDKKAADEAKARKLAAEQAQAKELAAKVHERRAEATKAIYGIIARNQDLSAINLGDHIVDEIIAGRVVGITFS